MTTKELHQGSPSIHGKTHFAGRWLGAAVGLAAVAAIAIAVYISAAPNRAAPAAVNAKPAAASVADAARLDELARIKDEGLAPVGQAVPDAAQQGVSGYIGAHTAGNSQSVPDAAQQGVTGYVAAHRAGQSQSVPDAAAQGVADYIAAHAARDQHLESVQRVPDAASQGIAGYIAAHTARDLNNAPDTAPDVARRVARDQHLQSVQSVPDAASQGVAGYLAAHSVTASQSVSVKAGGEDRSFHTPRTSDYPGVNSRPQPSPTPDFKY